MSQTSIIGGALLLAYLVFIVVNNELSCWLEVLGISSTGCCSAIGAGSANVGSQGSITISGSPGSGNVGTVTVNPPVIRNVVPTFGAGT